MKKLILFAAILFAGVSMVNGQNVKPDYQTIGHESVNKGSKITGTTILTVQLNSIQSISVNTSNVSLVYTTVQDYENGVRSGLINNHLEVYSTGAYKVNVGYSDAKVNVEGGTAAGSDDAEAMFKSINVAVSEEEGANVNAITSLKPSADLNNIIISSDNGVFGQKFDVDYQGAASYMNNIKGGAAKTYTANIIYTIIAS